MTEHPLDSVRPGGAGSSQPHAATERTGLGEVDAVLDAIESVGLLPVAQQVAVYETAHEQLRRALDARPDTDG